MPRGSDCEFELLNASSSSRSSSLCSLSSLSSLSCSGSSCSVSSSSASSWVRAFVSLFVASDTSALQTLCTRGKLRHRSRYRNLVWSLLLGLLPNQRPVLWPDVVNASRRRYDRLREEHLVDLEQVNKIDDDVALNHPLSQDETSAWNIFFHFQRMRAEIKQAINQSINEDGFILVSSMAFMLIFFQDVVRLPGNSLLSKEYVREMMINVLAVYARAHPQIGYKQGMHELLATLMLVQHDCCLATTTNLANTVDEGNVESNAYSVGSEGNGKEGKNGVESKSKKSDSLKNCKTKEVHSSATTRNSRPHCSMSSSDMRQVLLSVNDLLYLEHDVYALFEALMTRMWDWYYVPKDDHDQRCCSSSSTLSPAVTRLEAVWEKMLKHEDRRLYDHLTDAQVLPTTFGMNWTRLLFSRQFPKDHLRMWDAVIANEFQIVDHVVLAMVLAIRVELLSSDALHCTLMLVSQYPTTVEVQAVIDLAVHLRHPDRQCRPRRPSIKYDSQSKESLKNRLRCPGAEQIVRSFSVREGRRTKSTNESQIKVMVDFRRPQSSCEEFDAVVIGTHTDERLTHVLTKIASWHDRLSKLNNEDNHKKDELKSVCDAMATLLEEHEKRNKATIGVEALQLVDNDD